MELLTTDQIARNPECVTTRLIFSPGEEVIFRVLQAGDGAVLLSQETRDLFGPHPLTMEQGHRLCEEIDYGQTLRMIALIGSAPEVIAYLILILGVRESEIGRYREHRVVLESETDCTFAPSVADAYQNRRLGSLLMPHVLEVVRRLGYRRVVLSGGTQARNMRAVRFYEKFGFVKVGEFMTKINNYDMILEL